MRDILEKGRVRWLLVLSAWIGILAAPGSALADIVLFSDDFDSENGGDYQLNYFGFANWAVVDGTVDLIGVGSPWNWFPDHGLYVDMDGSTGNAGEMVTKSNTLTLDPGTYTLSFDLAGNQRLTTPETVTVQVSMGTLLDESFSLGRYDPFTTFERTFTVTETMETVISFEGAGGDNVGMLLDNVEIVQIPVPGAVLLGAIGLGLVGWVRKRFA